MRKSDEEKVKRVRSAKAWLEKAEESFGKQSDVRGELNLMLAEAEMKQMRKKERHSRGLRKIAAAGTAAVIALACWQLTGWEKTTTVRPLPAPAPAALQEEKAKPPESVPATPARHKSCQQIPGQAVQPCRTQHLLHHKRQDNSLIQQTLEQQHQHLLYNIHSPYRKRF